MRTRLRKSTREKRERRVREKERVENKREREGGSRKGNEIQRKKPTATFIKLKTKKLLRNFQWGELFVRKKMKE